MRGREDLVESAPTVLYFQRDRDIQLVGEYVPITRASGVGGVRHRDGQDGTSDPLPISPASGDGLHRGIALTGALGDEALQKRQWDQQEKCDRRENGSLGRSRVCNACHFVVSLRGKHRGVC